MRLHPGPGVLALAIGLSAAPLEAALATEVAVTVEGVESAGGTLRVTLCLESEYESWGCALRQRMERQPVQFLLRDLEGSLRRLHTDHGDRRRSSEHSGTASPSCCLSRRAK